MRARHTAIADRYQARARGCRYGAAGTLWPYRQNHVYLHPVRSMAGRGTPAARSSGSSSLHMTLSPLVTPFRPATLVRSQARTRQPSPSRTQLVHVNRVTGSARPQPASDLQSWSNHPVPDDRAAERRRFGPVPHRPTSRLVTQPGFASHQSPLAAATHRNHAPDEVQATVRRSVDEVGLTERVVAALERRQGGADSASAGSRLERPFTRPGAFPSVDVEGLAERVIAAIDRRTISHRERMGRG